MKKKFQNNPWFIDPESPSLVSSDRKMIIIYTYMCEIAMGSPLAGTCTIQSTDKNDQKEIIISNHAGCPAVWSDDSRYIALPIWTKQRQQQLAVYHVESQKLWLSNQKYRVLHLKSFKNGLIYGVDSPIHESKPLNIQIENFFSQSSQTKHID